MFFIIWAGTVFTAGVSIIPHQILGRSKLFEFHQELEIRTANFLDSRANSYKVDNEMYIILQSGKQKPLYCTKCSHPRWSSNLLCRRIQHSRTPHVPTSNARTVPPKQSCCCLHLSRRCSRKPDSSRSSTIRISRGGYIQATKRAEISVHLTCPSMRSGAGVHGDCRTDTLPLCQIKNAHFQSSHTHHHALRNVSPHSGPWNFPFCGKLQPSQRPFRLLRKRLCRNPHARVVYIRV